MTDKPASIPEDPIIAQARAALGGYFEATIAALGNDIRARLQADGHSPNANAINAFTEDMIKLLAARVKDALPNPRK